MMKKAFLLLFAATKTLAFEAVNSLVASSPFELYLQPTFTELNVEAQTIAAQVLGDVLASASSNLQDIDVVIQNLIYHPRHRRLNSNANLNLPSTTLTFAVLGTFSQDVNGQRDYLNTLIQDTFSTNVGRSELLEGLKASHASFKDLVNLQVYSIGAVPTTTGTDDSQGFFQSLAMVDIVLVVVSVCVLLGVTYMVIVSHRANRREHQRVLQLLSTHEAAANSLRELEREESASISSRLQLLKNGMRRSTSMSIAPLDKPKEEEDEPKDEEAGGGASNSEENGKEPKEVEQVPSIPTQPSSSSYHSAAELMATPHEVISIHSMRSEGLLSEQDVIPSPQTSSDEDDDGNYSESTNGYSSSGISSAHFSSSRWFQGSNTNNAVPTPSEDTFDVFAIDVDKYDDKLLLDDGSKTSATENFLEEWVKAIQVVPGEKTSVATPDTGSANSTGSASTPDCASIQSGSSQEKAAEKVTESVTHQATPEMSDNVEEPVAESAPVKV